MIGIAKAKNVMSENIYYLYLILYFKECEKN